MGEAERPAAGGGGGGGGGGGAGGGGSTNANETGFVRRAPERPEHPRRVRGGIRLASGGWPMELGVWGASIAGLVDRKVEAAVREEALDDYALRGQTKTMVVEPGVVRASVQGRRYRAYTVEVRFATHGAEAWDRLVLAMDGRPVMPAKILAGELPEDVVGFSEELGAPLLFEAGEVSRTTDSKEEGDFDKHAACVLMLLAEAVERDPFLLFTLRGILPSEFEERLRQRRAVTTSTTGAAPAYAPQPLPEAERVGRPLESEVEGFWEAGPALGDVELTLRKPEVSHPILRRLGPSPFEEGKFPLVGLLATCYDHISDAALSRPEDEEMAADSRVLDGSVSGGGDGEGSGAAVGGGGTGEAGGGGGGGGMPKPVTRARVKAKARAKRKGT